MSERSEAWFRIIVLVVSGIILGLWKGLIQIVTFVHWLMVLITGKRSKDLSNFSEVWNTQMYGFLTYMTFVTNKRPFPFESLRKSIGKLEK